MYIVQESTLHEADSNVLFIKHQLTLDRLVEKCSDRGDEIRIRDGIFMDGHTDLHVVNGWTLTATKY
ncbi:hypothetical protein TNCV_1457271 [Trichonephila clavipes]|nr:hypothetical protein TNCV_1457271 [Trichonephila clavipes]